ncbi:hypothetical protein [Muricoccus aerilatus]|uniref:hypothetical protein n=1 Tax=Muricoccus aerilatus TaxID=452982 RepID=UPI000B156AEF|nr:hypothetical protein [Roseomonas aerilata]
MRLTVYTNCSLRMLIYLGTKNEGFAAISEVARSYVITENHLTAVTHQLGRAGCM